MVVAFNTAATVFLQEKVAADYHGRVFGIYNMIYSSMFPLGLLFFGPLADIVSIESILRGTGLLMLILVVVMLKSKNLLAAGRSYHKDF